ncbi:MAG: hypothetical protein IOC98_11005 [Rhodobacter sp.]|nr:hypothetical protein [Rhodobacter sp.]
MGDMWFRAVPVAVAGRFARKGDEVTGTLKVPQPARRRRGVTLIEAVLYIAISLALIVGGLLFYQQASLQSRTNDTARAFAAMIADLRVMVTEMPDGVTTSMIDVENVLNTRGSVPANLWDATKPSGQRLRLPFAGMYASISGSAWSDGTLWAVLYIWQMPVHLCSRLFVVSAQKDTLFATGVKFAVIRDEGAGFANVFSTGITPSVAAATCRLSDANNNGLVRGELWLENRD